jgi:uncharacterized protein YwqG
VTEHPTEPAAAKARRGGGRYGCLVVVLALLVASGILAFQRPLVGIPALVAMALGCVYLMRHAVRRERAERADEVQRLRAISPPIGQAWRKLLQAEGLGCHVDALAKHTRTAVRLVTRPCEQVSLGQSRIGGTPDLPGDFEWPTYRGKPLAFVAQLDLAEIRRVLPDGPLPPDGSLWFFFDADQDAAGYSPKHAGGSAAVFRAAGTKLVRTPAPAGATTHGVFRACSIEAEAYEDIPDLGEDSPLDRVLDEVEAEAYFAIRTFLSAAGEQGAHKLLGLPEPVQSAMELECQLATNGIDCGIFVRHADPRVVELAAKKHEWRLLLQVDSDPSAGMMWGDAGRLYFWIRDEDLRERRFERCWTIMQCH